MTHPYDNRAAVPHWAEHFARWRAGSDRLRAMPGVQRDLPYARHPRALIDLFPAVGARRGTVAFLHGGYWQWNDRREFAFVAPPFQAAGYDVALVGYPLAPEFGVAGIVTAVAAGLETLRGPLAVCGWSAGAHLAVAASAALAVPVVALSGIYDLVPICATPLNDALGLTPATAAAVSPAFWPDRVAGPCLIGVGGAERPALRDQASRFAAMLKDAVALEWPMLDHYSILDALADPAGVVARDVLAFLNDRMTGGDACS